MEIERKWITTGWPTATATRILQMNQGYISVCPAVRIRSHFEADKPPCYILCFKGQGGLCRQEIETEISVELFDQLKDFIGKPLIQKEQRQYLLEDGLILEVNLVDKGQPTEFFYAEIEFSSPEQALAWKPSSPFLTEYLTHEVTNQKGQSMAEYWKTTRNG